MPFHPPLSGLNPAANDSHAYFFVSGQYKLDDDIWCAVHDSAKDMLTHMLVVNPSERWTAKKLLQHPWFTVRLRIKHHDDDPA